MNKKEFLIRQFAKTNKKNDENYVITRIVHTLDDLSVKIVTQQHVSLPDGRRALTDLYFPQIGIHIEVDERHHKDEENVKPDADREADLIDAPNHEIRRVDVTESIEQVHASVAEIVQLVQENVRRQRE